MATDQENKDQIWRLLRFNTRLADRKELCSLDEYIEGMKEG
jgi:HSP90 family molecular chaperone